MKNAIHAKFAKKSFFQRLWHCTRGDTAEKLVLVGLAISAAAGASRLLSTGASAAGTAIRDRTVQGGSGNAPTAE